MGSPALGLFVLWENSRREQERILDDLQEHFTVLDVHEVHWTPRLVRRNFERFYSDLDVRGVYHVHNKGAGPLLAVVLRDDRPELGERSTTRGPRPVNTRFVDAKVRYREWTDEFGVHCGETAWETRRDLLMMLGCEAEQFETTSTSAWDGRIETMHRDITGSTAWDSPAAMFDALNHAVPYVALGDATPDTVTSTAPHQRIQLLTADYHTLVTVLDARPVAGARQPHGGAFDVTVGGRRVRLELRVVGDNHLDPRWARACLDGRVLDPDHGLYRPGPNDQLAAFVYERLVHGTGFTENDAARLKTMACTHAVHDWPTDGADPAELARRLDEFLDEYGYRYTRALDPMVHTDHTIVGADQPALRQAVDDARRCVYRGTSVARGVVSTNHLRIRDWIVLRAPWVRRMKQQLSGLRR